MSVKTTETDPSVEAKAFLEATAKNLDRLPEIPGSETWHERNKIRLNLLTGINPPQYASHLVIRRRTTGGGATPELPHVSAVFRDKYLEHTNISVIQSQAHAPNPELADQDQEEDALAKLVISGVMQRYDRYLPRRVTEFPDARTTLGPEATVSLAKRVSEAASLLLDATDRRGKLYATYSDFSGDFHIDKTKVPRRSTDH